MPRDDNKVSAVPTHVQEEIKRSLDTYYAKPENFKTLKNLLGREKKLSLRVLEYTATHAHDLRDDAFRLSGVYQNFLDSSGKRMFGEHSRARTCT
jgi:hypothetical protein